LRQGDIALIHSAPTGETGERDESTNRSPDEPTGRANARPMTGSAKIRDQFLVVPGFRSDVLRQVF
jgi:hypothetical protein